MSSGFSHGRLFVFANSAMECCRLNLYIDLILIKVFIVLDNVSSLFTNVSDVFILPLTFSILTLNYIFQCCYKYLLRNLSCP